MYFFQGTGFFELRYWEGGSSTLMNWQVLKQMELTKMKRKKPTAWCMNWLKLKIWKGLLNLIHLLQTALEFFLLAYLPCCFVSQVFSLQIHLISYKNIFWLNQLSLWETITRYCISGFILGRYLTKNYIWMGGKIECWQIMIINFLSNFQFNITNSKLVNRMTKIIKKKKIEYTDSILFSFK